MKSRCRLPALRPAVLSVLLACGVSAGLGVGPAQGQETSYEEQREELEALRRELEGVQRDLREGREREDALQSELAALDRAESEARRRLRALEEERRSVEEQVAELRHRYERERERLGAQREALAAELRAAWMAGGHGPLRVLLEGRDPAATQRLLVYHDYVREARTRRMQGLLAELAELGELRAELDEELGRLAAAQEREEAERRRVEQTLAERREERARLERALTQREDAEQRLREEISEQEALLERLRERLADVPEHEFPFESFAEARGRLPWPLEGTVEAGFGERRSGDLQRTGIVIEADGGAEVTAVAPGRVVFSDWLRGLGLLVIIDHGDGYLTLYGHGQALYADVGEWVDTGQIVATAGSSGARTRPGVYFEIRRGEQPVDPTDWLR